jgi:hypothetical protein
MTRSSLYFLRYRIHKRVKYQWAVRYVCAAVRNILRERYSKEKDCRKVDGLYLTLKENTCAPILPWRARIIFNPA